MATAASRAVNYHRDNSRLLFKVSVVNVASVFLDGGSDAVLDELLDHGHNLVVVFQNGRVGNDGLVQQDLVAGIFEKVHQDAKDFRSHKLPLAFGLFGDGDKVSSKVDGLDSVDLEQVLGQGRL